MKTAGGRSQLLAMILIGSGLMVLGVVAMVMLPKTGGGFGNPSNSDPGAAIAVPVAVNFPAPEISLTDLDGQPVSLADYAGQVVLVNNWATWCPPCKAEMPTLQAFFDDHREAGFALVAIDAAEPAERVQEFVENYGLTFAVWLDPQEKAMQAFRNDYLPSSYVLDKKGVVRLTWTGAISRETLEKYVTPLLEE
jgi:peroxiredoxin